MHCGLDVQKPVGKMQPWRKCGVWCGCWEETTLGEWETEERGGQAGKEENRECGQGSRGVTGHSNIF